jgi:uncharacterized protein with FMN-binding domain
VRKETRFALGIVGLSAVATSYLVGHQTSQPSVALATSAVATSSDPTPTAEVAPTQTDAPAAAEPSPSQSATPEKTPAPTATADPTPTATAADGTYLSSNVSYRYGNIQLEVTVQSGQLSAINLIQATTEGRGYDQAPPMLVDAALQAGSADFGNLSGATFTSMAFKQALTDALSQAGL